MAKKKRLSPCCGAKIETTLADGVLAGFCAKCNKTVIRINPKTGREELLYGKSPWEPGKVIGPKDLSSFRVTRRRARGRFSARTTIRCKCCKEVLVICHDMGVSQTLEIGGVMGSVQEWRNVLLPLLGVNLPAMREDPDRLWY